VAAGKEQLVVPLKSADAVRRAKPAGDAFSRLKSEDGLSMAYVFADGGSAVESRFFFPSGPSIVEDPATGSACANLGGWFAITRPGESVERTVSQGEAVKRPSTLFLTVTPASQPGGQVRILVGGNVIELGRGSLSL
jgi:PhzF family phenazine biosynthesis protein